MYTINTSNFLLPNIADKLCFYKKERVSLIINDFIEINKQMDSYHYYQDEVNKELSNSVRFIDI